MVAMAVITLFVLFVVYRVCAWRLNEEFEYGQRMVAQRTAHKEAAEAAAFNRLVDATVEAVRKMK